MKINKVLLINIFGGFKKKLSLYSLLFFISPIRGMKAKDPKKTIKPIVPLLQLDTHMLAGELVDIKGLLGAIQILHRLRPTSHAMKTKCDKALKMIIKGLKKNEDIENILMLAASNGSPYLISILQNLHPTLNINITDKEGFTPLLRAIQNGHKKVIKLLMQHEKIDVGSKKIAYNLIAPHQTKTDGLFPKVYITPLLFGILKGKKRIVQLLLNNKKIDVNMPTRTHRLFRNPFVLVTDTPIEKTIKSLLDVGTSPLVLATVLGNKEIISLLVKRKDINIDVIGRGGRRGGLDFGNPPVIFRIVTTYIKIKLKKLQPKNELTDVYPTWSLNGAL